MRELLFSVTYCVVMQEIIKYIGNSITAGSCTIHINHTWFLKIASVQTSVCACVPLRLLITSDVMWTPYDY